MIELTINYTGNSMFPTLRKGDILRVEPYKDSEISSGDVIVYRRSYDGLLVVHRVVSIDKGFVQTKGDNAQFKDNVLLERNDIIGHVISVRRGEKGATLFRGFSGRLYGLTLSTGKHIRVFLSDLLRPVYNWLAQTGILRNLFSHLFRTKVSGFKYKGGLDLQLHWGRYLIGRRFPGKDQWHIRPPFRLFVDEGSLPGIDPDELRSIENRFLDKSEEQGRPFGQRVF
jgi:signal peptidase I